MFKQEMLDILNDFNPQPTTLFRIAIEEGEAWLLGDRNALKSAYPRAKEQVLRTYVQDSICGTWEKLADAVYPGGSQKLKQLGWPHTGKAKCEWANNITPHLDLPFTHKLHLRSSIFFVGWVKRIYSTKINSYPNFFICLQLPAH